MAVEEVNQWVENVTNGHVSNFLETLPHEVELMLINGVHFKGELDKPAASSCPGAHGT